MADHVLVKCHKGFDDTNTRKAIPCLWRRKSFVDNCKMFDVKRIVFLDSVNHTLLSNGYFFKVIQPTEARFWASEILAYTSVVATFL